MKLIRCCSVQTNPTTRYWVFDDAHWCSDGASCLARSPGGCVISHLSPTCRGTRWLYICYDTNQPSQPFFLLCGHSFLLRFKVLSQSSLHSRSTFSLSLSLKLITSIVLCDKEFPKDRCFIGFSCKSLGRHTHSLRSPFVVRPSLVISCTTETMEYAKPYPTTHWAKYTNTDSLVVIATLHYALGMATSGAPPATPLLPTKHLLC